MHIFVTENDIKFFKALGDETRLCIVRFVLHKDFCACEFDAKTKRDQTTVSRHLKILEEAGILKKQRKGRNIIFGIKNESMKKKLLLLGIKPCC